ncbi:MAG: PTS fructose transporter subunit IIA, partial [Betaproteobacteria bacterium]|nr:PTS fructose transporter subunit IIA [Betaproteobacteria bacterium]
MIGVLVITHGTIGEALLASAAQILGAPAQAAALGVARADDPDAVLEGARALAARLDSGEGLL